MKIIKFFSLQESNYVFKQMLSNFQKNVGSHFHDYLYRFETYSVDDYNERVDDTLKRFVKKDIRLLQGFEEEMWFTRSYIALLLIINNQQNFVSMIFHDYVNLFNRVTHCDVNLQSRIERHNSSLLSNHANVGEFVFGNIQANSRNITKNQRLIEVFCNSIFLRKKNSKYGTIIIHALFAVFLVRVTTKYKKNNVSIN